MSRNLDSLPPKPSYQCHFPSYKHPNSEQIIAEVQKYFSERWPWPSERHKEKYLKQDIELWISYIAPHALDARIGLATIWITFIFFVDDILDNAPDDEAKDLCLRLINCLSGESTPEEPTPVDSIAVDLQSRLQTLSTDEDSLKAADLMKQKTLEWCQTTADPAQRLAAFQNFHEYLDYRITEVGNWSVPSQFLERDVVFESFACRMICAVLFWASGISLPDDLVEGEAIHILERVAGHHFIAINDLYSYRKELRAFQDRPSAGEEGIMNCIPLLMKERSLDYHSVLSFLTDFLFAVEVEFPEIVARAKTAHPQHASVIERTAQCLEAFMAGNTTWSSICRRYNALT